MIGDGSAGLGLTEPIDDEHMVGAFPKQEVEAAVVAAAIMAVIVAGNLARSLMHWSGA